MRTTYGDSEWITADGPFRGEMIRANNVLCPDGIRRNAYPSGDGTADTFYSVPAYVHGRHGGRTVRVYGYVTIDHARAGDGTEDTVRFVPYRYRTYAHVVCHPARSDDATCLHCGTETVQVGTSSGSLVHVATSSLFCDPDAARRSDWDSGAAEDVHARRTACVRDAQSYRPRTAAEKLPLDEDGRTSELAAKDAR